MIPSKHHFMTKVAIVAVGLVVNLAIGRAIVHNSGVNGLYVPAAQATGTTQGQTATGPERDDFTAPRS